MKLSAFFGQISQNYTDSGGIETTPAMEQGLKNGMEAVRGRLPGQTLSGEVLLREGNELLLSIGKNQLLQARLEGSISALPGQVMAFQIRNNSGSKLVLSPLFENTGQDPNVARALQAAGIPENSVTGRMVREMMQEGLPIDKQSLYQMNRLISANPQVDIQTLVQMQRLSLPVTPENIFQFEAYKNYQHQLGESLSDIAEAFTQTFQEITGSKSLGEGISFYRDVLGALFEHSGESSLSADQAAGSPEGLKGENGGLLREALPGRMMGLSQEETGELARQLRGAGVPERVTDAVLGGRISGHELLNEIQKLLADEVLPHREAVLGLLEGRAFKQLLKNEMNAQWLLEPKEVGEENSVERFYERLNSQMNRLSHVLSQTAGENTPLAKAVSNVTGNIDFMNQLNHMFSYVQIPLKMQGKNASGELFVYTNKKSLAKKEGTVSALLHLDMEYLGSVDVHVALTNQKVSTKFYLKDDAALDLIARNIDILNQRLESRGYSMSAEFLSRDEDTNVMEEILKQGKNVSALAGYSFDARA